MSKKLWEEDDTPSQITVNETFAKGYHEKKVLRDLQRYLKAKNPKADYDDPDEPSDSDEEDSDGIAAGDVADHFLTLLPMIVKKDEKIFKAPKDTAFFPQMEDEDSDDEQPTAKPQVEKPLRYKDMVRNEILEKQKKFDVGEEIGSSEDEDSFVEDKDLPLAEQEKKAKQDFLQAASGVESNFVLEKKTKTREEGEEEETEYEKFLAKRAKQAKKTKEDKILLDFWKPGDTVNEDERFLRNFILKKGWVDRQKFSEPEKEQEEHSESEDSEHEILADEFESKYNFRFEEPGNTFDILSFGRQPKDSMRKANTKNQERRQRKKQRKEEAKKEKEQEMKRLLTVKKTQIMDRLKYIEEVSGSKNIPIATKALETDFDPEEYDRQMAEIFNDDYYDEEEDEKPVFEDSEEEQAPLSFADQVIAKASKSGVKDEFEQYLQEFYDLNYEDFIGDQPVRFKYTPVQPIDYGLDVVDILEKDENELRSIVSLKRLAPYREDQGAWVPKKKKSNWTPNKKQAKDSKKPQTNKRKRTESTGETPTKKHKPRALPTPTKDKAEKPNEITTEVNPKTEKTKEITIETSPTIPQSASKEERKKKKAWSKTKAK